MRVFLSATFLLSIGSLLSATPGFPFSPARAKDLDLRGMRFTLTQDLDKDLTDKVACLTADGRLAMNSDPGVLTPPDPVYPKEPRQWASDGPCGSAVLKCSLSGIPAMNKGTQITISEAYVEKSCSGGMPGGEGGGGCVNQANIYFDAAPSVSSMLICYPGDQMTKDAFVKMMSSISVVSGVASPASAVVVLPKFADSSVGTAPQCALTDQMSPRGTLCVTSTQDNGSVIAPMGNVAFVRVAGGWQDTGESGKVWLDGMARDLSQDAAVNYCKNNGQVLPTFTDLLVAQNHGALEILRDMKDRWFWSSSVGQEGGFEGDYSFFDGFGDIGFGGQMRFAFSNSSHTDLDSARCVAP